MNMEERLKQLVGMKIVGLCKDSSSPDDVFWGLVLRKGTRKKIAWITCDPEGNGPGHLDIVEDNE